SYTQAYTGSYIIQAFANPYETVEGVINLFSSANKGISEGSWTWWDAAKIGGSLSGGYAGFKGINIGGTTYIPGLAPNILNAVGESTGYLASIGRFTASVAETAIPAYIGSVGLGIALSYVNGGNGFNALHQMAQDTDMMWRTSIGFSAMGNAIAPRLRYVKESRLGAVGTSTAAGALALGTDYALSKLWRGEDYSYKKGATVFGTVFAAAMGLSYLNGKFGEKLPTAMTNALAKDWVVYPLGAGITSLTGGIVGSLFSDKPYDYASAIAQFAVPAAVTALAVKYSTGDAAKTISTEVAGRNAFWKNVWNRVDPFNTRTVNEANIIVKESSVFWKGENGGIKNINLSGTVPYLLGTGAVILNKLDIPDEWKHAGKLALLTTIATHVTLGLGGKSGGSSGITALFKRAYDNGWNGWGVASAVGTFASGGALLALNKTDSEGKYYIQMADGWRRGLTIASAGLLLAGIGGYKEVLTNLKKPIWTDNILKDGRFHKVGEAGITSSFIEPATALQKIGYYAGNRALYWGSTAAIGFVGPAAIEWFTGKKYEDSGDWQAVHKGLTVGLLAIGIAGPGAKPFFENLGRSFNLLTKGISEGPSILAYELAKTALPTIPALTVGMAGFPDIQNYLYSMESGPVIDTIKNAFGFDDFKAQYKLIMNGKEYDSTKVPYFEAQRDMMKVQIEKSRDALDRTMPGYDAQVKVLNARLEQLGKLQADDFGVMGKFRWVLRAESGWEGFKTALWFGPTLYFIRPLLEMGLRRIPISGEFQAALGEGGGKHSWGDALFPEVEVPGAGAFSKAANGVLRTLYRFQSLTMEEQVRENIFSFAFNPMVEAGGIKLSDVSDSHYGLKNQIMENF
ncbi:MAG: hypothetical protein ACYDEQ_12110, partial [Desulfocucumaceae bacterium]